MLKNILILFCCCAFFSCLAQDLQFNVQYFDMDDGLAGREVFSAHQDDRGVIWLGTNHGLNSFDGKNFRAVKDSTFLLSSGEITGIKKTKNGHLWLEKRGEGPILFDPQRRERITDFKGYELTKELKILFPRGRGSKVFFKDEPGQVYYYDESKGILPFGKIKIDPSDYARPSPWNTLLISQASSNRLLEMNMAGEILRTSPILLVQYNTYDWEENYLTVFHQGLKDSIQVAQKLLTFEKDGSLKPISLKINDRALRIGDLKLTHTQGKPKDYICFFKLTKDSRGNIWMIANDKIWLFDKDGNFKKDLTSRLSSLSENLNLYVNHLFIDADDRCWVSTVFGLFLIQIKSNPFDHYLVDNNKHSTRGIAELPDNKLLILAYGGAQILDRTTKETSERKIGLEGIGLIQEAVDTILFTTHSPTLGKMVDNTFTLNSYSAPAPGSIDLIVPFRDQKNNQLYIGSVQGLFYVVNDSIRKYPRLNQYKDMENHEISCFYQNEAGIWIGSHNGIYLLDPLKGIINHFKLPHKHINYIHEDSSGEFWIATNGGGLINWNPAKNKMRQLTTKNGLSHNVITMVYEDENEYLWMPSNDGLMRFDKQNDGVVIFNTSDGISHQEFNRYSHYRAKDGRFYFGGINGVNAFYPSEINFSENEAPFIVTELQQYDAQKGKLVDKSHLFFSNPTIELAPGDKFFTLNFSLLDYLPETHLFAWRIDGLEEEWNFQRENSLRINSLPHGHYTLQIKAKGQAGSWAKNELSIPIIVRQPFYQSPLCFLICGTILGLIFYGGYRIRLSNLTKRQIYLENEIAERTTEISKQNLMLKQLNSDKDQFFSIIGHDLRGPLLSLRGISKKVSFLIQQNRMQEVHQLGESIEQSTTQVTKLLDNLLNWALVQKGQFPYYPQAYHLTTVVQEMVDVYQSAADIKNIALENLTKADHQVFIDRNAISTVIRNLIDNAIKFTGQGGKIHITSTIAQGEVILAIMDTGTGIAPAILSNIFEFNADRKKMVKGTGLGLVLCKDLVEMNNGSIEVESELEKGTKFYVRIPRFIR